MRMESTGVNRTFVIGKCELDGVSLECLGTGCYLPNNQSPVLLGTGCMLILRYLGTPYPVKSVKFTGLLHLIARPLTGPLASIPASIPLGWRNN